MKKRESHYTTEELCSLGMALSADRITMEQRIRGIFARKKSALSAAAAAVLLAGVVGIGCFTTACRPVLDNTASEDHTGELAEVFSEKTDAEVSIDDGSESTAIAPLLTFAGSAEAEISGDTIIVTGKDGTVKKYECVDDGIMEHSDKIPDRKYVAPAEAAQEFARVGVTIYGKDAPEGPIHVAMQYYEGFSDVYYEISFGARYDENDGAFGLVDAESGTLLQFEVNHWGMTSKKHGDGTVNQKIRDWNWDDPAYQEIHTSDKALATAMELVRTCFPTGNIMPKRSDIWDAGSHTDGEQISWDDGYLAMVDAYVRMDKDPCYYVQVAVPLEDGAKPMISIFNTYPRGWDYCNNQIWDPSVLEEELQWREDARNGIFPEEPPYEPAYRDLIDQNEAAVREKGMLSKVGTAFEPVADDYQGDPEIFSKLFLEKENVWPDDSYASIDILESWDQLETRLDPGTLLIVHGIKTRNGTADICAVYTRAGLVYADMDSKSVIGVPIYEFEENKDVRFEVVTFNAPGMIEPTPTPVP